MAYLYSFTPPATPLLLHTSWHTSTPSHLMAYLVWFPSVVRFLQTATCHLPRAACNWLRATYYSLPITHYPPHCPLPTYCPLPTTYYLLPATHNCRLAPTVCSLSVQASDLSSSSPAQYPWRRGSSRPTPTPTRQGLTSFPLSSASGKWHTRKSATLQHAKVGSCLSSHLPHTTYG